MRTARPSLLSAGIVKMYQGKKLWRNGRWTRRIDTVTVEEAPTSFSPFSLVDCILLSHFSFNDFIVVAFPDLARDLDIQI